MQSLFMPWGIQEFEAPRFPDIRKIKVVKCRPYAPAIFTPQGIFLMLISVRDWIDKRVTVRPEEWKVVMALSGIEPSTFQLLAQCLNQIRHHLPLSFHF